MLKISDFIDTIFLQTESEYTEFKQEIDLIGYEIIDAIADLYKTLSLPIPAPNYEEIFFDAIPEESLLRDNTLLGYYIVTSLASGFTASQGLAETYLKIPSIPPYPYISLTVKTTMDSVINAFLNTQGLTPTTEVGKLTLAFDNFVAEAYLTTSPSS